MSGITFTGKPKNYGVIDKNVTRSAQPEKNDFQWLKDQGVTDVINFRYDPPMRDPGFIEKEEVEKCGMRYHNVPTDPYNPSEKQVGQFLDLVENITQKGGKAHIHCLEGADRTGMYSWIYKQKHGIGSMEENKKEMLKFGHHKEVFTSLVDWITNLLQKDQRKAA